MATSAARGPMTLKLRYDNRCDGGRARDGGRACVGDGSAFFFSRGRLLRINLASGAPEAQVEYDPGPDPDAGGARGRGAGGLPRLSLAARGICANWAPRNFSAHLRRHIAYGGV